MSFDSAAIARDFSRAAARYDVRARLQRRALEKLLVLTRSAIGKDGIILDAGCGTGRLKDYLPRAIIAGVDIAHGMARAAAARGEHAVTGDIRRLPFANAAFGGAVCSLCLQWVDNPGDVFAELHRVLKPGGHIALATLGPETLRELRRAFAVAEGASHVSPFSALEALRSQAEACGFRVAEKNTELLRERYAHPREVMRALKEIGAGNKRTDRIRGLLTPRYMERVYAAYPSLRVEGEDRRVVATWEIYYLLLEKAAA